MTAEKVIISSANGACKKIGETVSCIAGWAIIAYQEIIFCCHICACNASLHYFDPIINPAWARLLPRSVYRAGFACILNHNCFVRITYLFSFILVVTGPSRSAGKTCRDRPNKPSTLFIISCCKPRLRTGISYATLNLHQHCENVEIGMNAITRNNRIVQFFGYPSLRAWPAIPFAWNYARLQIRVSRVQWIASCLTMT